MVKDYNAETIFPWWLAEEVIDILKKKDVQFKTFSDFPVSINYKFLDRYNYLLEFAKFKSNNKYFIIQNLYLLAIVLNKLSSKLNLKFDNYISNNAQTVVFLQHDADRQPYKTIDMMKLEMKCGVKSSNFFFNKRNVWDNDNEDYNIDIVQLQKLEKFGFEIGYHLNAYELSQYKLSSAFEIIEKDIEFFSKHFNLKSFVPHGGVPGPKNINNDSIPYSGILRDYTWCYNGKGLYKDKGWSDGMISFRNVVDPRVVAKNVRKGERVSFLMHPQYWGDKLMSDYELLPLSKNTWWKQLWYV
jgi:hypothetical protein